MAGVGRGGGGGRGLSGDESLNEGHLEKPAAQLDRSVASSLTPCLST